MSQSVKAEIKKARAAFWGVGIFSGFINILALSGSMYMLQVYDRVMPSKSVPTLIGFSILLIVLYSAYAALDHFRIRVMSRIGITIDRALRARVLEAVLLLPLRMRQGPESQQPIRDLDQIRSFLSSLGPTALFDLPWLPIYLALVFMLHPVLGLFATAGAAILVVLTIITEIRTKVQTSEATKTGGVRAQFSESMRRNAEVIRSMGLEPRVAERWNTMSEAHLAAQLGMSDAATSIGAFSKVMRLLLQSGTLGLGAYLAIHGQISAGAIIAASIVTSRALAPIELAIAHWKGFTAMRQSIQRLETLFGAMPKQAEVLSLPAPSKQLAVQNLVVVPPGQTLPTISDITFQLEAGDALGVIGPSASGKSTLVRAIVGAWQPVARGGSVRLDGATLDQWLPKDLGTSIGYLPQDIELFDGTVAENIARLDPNAPSDKVIAAATLAGIHDMIVHLPEGYQTRIGDAGARLSSGQRQLVGLARALYGDPFLVVLDEPNSNLDAQGDAALARAIVAIRQRRGIVIVVAHRPSALSGVNKVLAMMNGRVHAFGPRDEVLKKILQPQAVPTSPMPDGAETGQTTLKVVAANSGA